MEKLIEAKGVSKLFEKHVALDNVNLSLEEGKIHGLLGPNGAGKTTLIRILNHITAPDSGTVTFDGHALTGADVVNIGYLPEERGLYKKMRVGDQALFFARLKGLDSNTARKELKTWFERLEMTGWWDKKVEELSKGMAQKVQFVITVLHRPRLLIFDEPFSGFDPVNAAMLKREILRLRDQGATILFSTHNMASVEELCDTITLINKSRVVLEGSVKELKQQYSRNRYAVTYEGDFDATACTACTDIEYGPADVMGHKTLTLGAAPGASRRDMIDTLNASTSLISLQPLYPTMDEIFVRAVSQH